MELRDIEIFLTLAEELHFGRTAERLHVSQARVSQAIKQQERRIGAALFERTSRKVALTPIGEQLRADLAIGYQRITEAVDSAIATAQGERGRLVLGVMGPPGAPIASVTDRFLARYPGSELRQREIPFGDPFGSLRAGDLDIAMVWFPVREPDLTVGPVMITEPLFVVASVDHPLAARRRVCLEDLGDHPVVQPALPVPAYWEEAVHPRTTPSGRSVVRGPAVSTWEEVMAAVSTGQAITCCGVRAIMYRSRPDIVFLPIDDGPTLEWGLIWRSASTRPLVRAFADIAKAQGPVALTDPTEQLSP